MDTRERIICKSFELFAANGIKRISMDEIASSLGISKRTIYGLFKDKEEILLQSLNMLSEKEWQMISELEKVSDNVVDTLLKMIHRRTVQNNFPSVRFFEDIDRYYPAAKKDLEEKREESLNYTKEFMRKGIEEGVIRGNLNIDVVAYIINEVQSHIFSKALSAKELGFSFHDLIFTTSINLLRGISTEKGIKIIDEYLDGKTA